NYTRINPNIQINYQGVGSGTGINDLSARSVDFGASDAPLSNSQIQGAQNALTIPDTIGAVVVAYNIPSIPTGLKLTANVTAQIFEGVITIWNDSRIQNLNPGITLPQVGITIAHRSDSSGTTFVFSGYLNATYPVWTLGQSKTISWPSGSIGANGNPGVAAVVQGTKYTIGYVELAYALSASPVLTYASLWNPAGQAYIAPSLGSTALAASSLSASYLPAGDAAASWQPINLLNSANPGAYPIVTFSYIMVYKELNVYGSSMTLTRAQDLVNYLWFIVHDGQNQATPLNYVALPQNVVSNAEATIRLITYNGQQLHA
ncbi:MAG TPA: phosphate ABC transporter substrate-binding protein PstS, partial [Candidatus Bathyarchaeia archaeon]|nr:phosphate ABC transporter substrate-binding protein PstS [Candidatus Bathyarchaeia archaeon]